MTNKPRSIPWYHSLRFRLVAAAIAIELVMLSVLLANSFHLLDEAVKSQTQTRLEALSPLLDAALAGRVFQRDHSEVKAIINRLTTSECSDIRYIAVFDSFDKLLAMAGDFYPNSQAKEDLSVTSALTDLTYDARLPLTIVGNRVGTVHFGISLTSMVATQNKVIKDGMFIAAVEILLSLLLLVSGGYLITRHIRSLTEGARRIAQGDYGAQLHVPGRDEISMLADDFNTMSAAIKNHVTNLEASESRFQTIYNAVNEAILIYDITTGGLLDVNQRMCAMYGYSTREEAILSEIGSRCAGISPYSREEALAKMQAAAAGTPQIFDWHARAKDGHLFWVEISLRLARIGNDDRLIAVIRDISERKKAEEEKNNAIARFQTLVDSLDAMVYVANMDTYEILFINQFGRNMLKQDVTGRICWQALQTGQSGPCPFCTNDRLLDSNGKPNDTLVWEFQNTITNEWYECRDQAIQWIDGRLVRMEIAINITARKTAEKALAAETERLAVTLRSIGDGVITTDTQGRIVLINSVAERLTGWSQQEAQGRHSPDIFVVVNEKTGQLCENPVEKVLASGKVVGLANHTALIARDGREYKIADSGAPILDREGRTIGVVLVFQDITDKQRMEEEMLKVGKLESVGVLAGGIAHDFNNILTAIVGNINMALLNPDLDAITRKRLIEAEKASIRAKDLTQQLLTFSKGGEPIRKTAPITDVIRDSANFVLHGSNVSCHFNLPDDLWLVDIDRGQISQVIQNLIINAKHALPDGGIVEVGCKNIEAATPPDKALPGPGRYVQITISDKGIGIPDNLLGKIFDPYFTTKEGGSGLGLAISHAIINKHDGAISVQSKQGEGTTFTLCLPASISAQQPEENRKAMATTRRQARVMIMDDENMIREITGAMLTMLDHEALEAKDGREAIELYKKEFAAGRPIDLLIMDLTIPGGMGGKEAAQEILAINPAAKLVVASGYSNDPVMAHYREYGFAATISKPFQIEDLISVLNQTLS
jgi:PAS domain S-box-containing protein